MDVVTIIGSSDVRKVAKSCVGLGFLFGFGLLRGFFGVSVLVGFSFWFVSFSLGFFVLFRNIK